MPAIDVHQEGDTTVVRTELAGVDPKDVEITVEDSVLRISGTRQKDESVSEGDWIRQERFVGRFEREIALPPGIDPGAIEATANNGVIEIRVPRPQTPEPHRVELRSDASSGTNGNASSIEVTSKDNGAATNMATNNESPTNETNNESANNESTSNESASNDAPRPAKKVTKTTKATKKQTSKSASARR